MQEDLQEIDEIEADQEYGVWNNGLTCEKRWESRMRLSLVIRRGRESQARTNLNELTHLKLLEENIWHIADGN